MNIKRLTAHAACAAAGSLVWSAGISLAPGSAPWWLWAVAGMPEVVAAISLVITHANDALTAPALNRAITREANRQLTAPRRPEVTRPPVRRELVR